MRFDPISHTYLISAVAESEARVQVTLFLKERADSKKICCETQQLLYRYILLLQNCWKKFVLHIKKAISSFASPKDREKFLIGLCSQ